MWVQHGTVQDGETLLEYLKRSSVVEDLKSQKQRTTLLLLLITFLRSVSTESPHDKLRLGRCTVLGVIVVWKAIVHTEEYNWGRFGKHQVKTQNVKYNPDYQKQYP